MQREASTSTVIGVGTSQEDEPPLSSCLNLAPIYFSRPNFSAICYKTVAPNELPPVYKDIFKGPCVLVRLGPPYKPNGDINSNGDIKSSTPPVFIAQAVLDGVAKDTDDCKRPDNGGLTSQMESTFLSRSAQIRINMASKASYVFSVPVSTNPTYDGSNVFERCTANNQEYKETGCGSAESTVYHYKPENFSSKTSFTGASGKENVFYFNYPYSNYTLSGATGLGACSYDNCLVKRGNSSFQLFNVDVLIFPDKEIRPTR
jgi:hypothetical protein